MVCKDLIAAHMYLYIRENTIIFLGLTSVSPISELGVHPVTFGKNGWDWLDRQRQCSDLPEERVRQHYPISNPKLCPTWG